MTVYNHNDTPEINQLVRESEEALLGSILINSANGDRTVVEELKGFISPIDFHDYRNRRIYKAMSDLKTCPHQINVAQELYLTKQLQEYDCSYLCHLIAQCPTWMDYLDYAKIVKDFSLRRNGLKAIKPNGKSLNKGIEL